MSHRFGCFFAIALTVLLLAGCASGRAVHKNTRFEDFYECYIIIEVESSPYLADEFEQIDCEDFMSIIARAKWGHNAFTPAFELNLYDDEGVRYKLYFSKSCRFFRIDSNYFRLSKRQARLIKSMLDY